MVGCIIRASPVGYLNPLSIIYLVVEIKQRTLIDHLLDYLLLLGQQICLPIFLRQFLSPTARPTPTPAAHSSPPTVLLLPVSPPGVAAASSPTATLKRWRIPSPVVLPAWSQTPARPRRASRCGRGGASLSSAACPAPTASLLPSSDHAHLRHSPMAPISSRCSSTVDLHGFDADGSPQRSKLL